MAFTPLTVRFSEALVYAADLHRGQRRKGSNIPYVSHLLAVASIALESGADEDEAIAALLHDAIEDAPSDLGDQAASHVRRWIEFKFGRCVLEIVEACTDTDVTPKPPWIPRRVRYIASVQHKGRSALLVSAADKLHNARAVLGDFRTLGADVFKRFNPDAGKSGTLGYYRAITTAISERAEILHESRVKRLVTELDRVVTTLEEEVGERAPWPPVSTE